MNRQEIETAADKIFNTLNDEQKMDLFSGVVDLDELGFADTPEPVRIEFLDQLDDWFYD